MLVAQVLQLLTRCIGIEAFHAHDASAALAHDGVVLVTGAADIDTTAAFIADVRRERPEISIVVATPCVDDDGLVRLIDAGATDFVSTQSTPAELGARLQRAGGVAHAVDDGAQRSSASPQIRGFVYASQACAAIAARLPILAGCDANVLIAGETGTGKEVCAQAIHYLSARSARPWVAVNCGAIPAELVETELFGHVKGAYTTAHTSRSGLVREAEGGTLFLDDVDCLPLPAQAKLLRFLQEREYRPVGSNHVQHADVRIVAASNCNLYDLAQREKFRQDLYFRLNVLNIAMPALRERREDIPILAAHFARHFSREFNRCARKLTVQAMAKLSLHHWPGNVRELKHVIERAVLLAQGATLGEADIDIDLAAPTAPANACAVSFRDAKKRVVDDFERSYIEQLLTAHSGNITIAARTAKKDRRAFFELMRKHQIEPRRFRSQVL
jgi:DNA-binding NtrC family response regulator